MNSGLSDVRAIGLSERSVRLVVLTRSVRSVRPARGADSRASRSFTNFFARESGRCERSIRALRSSGASVGLGFDAVCF